MVPYSRVKKTEAGQYPMYQTLTVGDRTEAGDWRYLAEIDEWEPLPSEAIGWPLTSTDRPVRRPNPMYWKGENQTPIPHHDHMVGGFPESSLKDLAPLGRCARDGTPLVPMDNGPGQTGAQCPKCKFTY